MTLDFATANNLFRKDQFKELYSTKKGLRFLKLRSLSRPEYLRQLANESGHCVDVKRNSDLLKAIFEAPVSVEQIDKVARSIFDSERAKRRGQEDDLISQLYRLNEFDWGGLHQNSLEKTIVDNYVKKIRSFDDLNTKIENDIHNSMRGYVLCSWYNHWTSIIIEDIFRDHRNVFPAVGLIKKIDFFVGDIPFDLKVTYLPEGFVKDKRKEQSLRPELTLLKNFCKQKKLPVNTDLPDARLMEDMWIKIEDHPSTEAKQIIDELRSVRIRILEDCMNDKSILIRWFYENQGVRRFDASNRLFLVLVDCQRFFDSWKMKRAKPLLTSTIHRYLTDHGERPGIDVAFSWEGSRFDTTSEIIFVTKGL